MTPCARCGCPMHHGTLYCPRCGLPKGTPPSGGPWSYGEFCWSCGERRHSTGLRCEACGALKEPFPTPPPSAPPPVDRAVGHPVASLFLVAAAAMGAIQTILTFIAGFDLLDGFGCLFGCGAPVATLFCVYGAYQCYLGDRWGVAAACAMAGVLVLGPLFTGTLLALVALALILSQRQRFLA